MSSDTLFPTQQDLPPLPLPAPSDALELYYSSVKPLLTDEELVRKDRVVWPGGMMAAASTGRCVHVYDECVYAHERKCANTMYSLDAELAHAFGAPPSQFGQAIGRVTGGTCAPEHAAAYLIPFSQHCMAAACKPTPPRRWLCHKMETVLLEALQAVSHRWPWFNRSGGRDHFVALTFDAGMCGLVGNKSIVRALAGTRFDTVRGIAVSTDQKRCFRNGVDFGVPPMLFTGTAQRQNHTFPLAGVPAYRRAPSVFFRGQIDNANAVYPSDVRNVVWGAYGCAHQGPGGCPVDGVVVEDSNKQPPTEHQRPYILMLQTSRFCLHLPGFQFWSPRLFEAMVCGCVPVAIVSNASASELEGYTFPFLRGGRRPPILVYSRADVSRLPQLLFSLPEAALKRLTAEMREYVRQVHPVQRVVARVKEWMLESASRE